MKLANSWEESALSPGLWQVIQRWRQYPKQPAFRVKQTPIHTTFTQTRTVNGNGGMVPSSWHANNKSKKSLPKTTQDVSFHQSNCQSNQTHRLGL